MNTPHMPKKLPIKTVLVLVVLLALVINWPQQSAETAQNWAQSLQIFATTAFGGEQA